MDGAPDDFRVLAVEARDLRPGARFDTWRQVLSQKLMQISGDPIADESFWANAWLRILPGLRTGTGAFAASRYSRTKQTVAADNDDFVLMVNLEGSFSAVQRGRELTLGEGDAYLMACAEPGTFTRQSSGILSCVRFPARAVAPRVPNLYDRVARRIPKDCEILRLLLAYMRMTDGVAFDDEQVRSVAVSHVYDLVALALNPTRENICETEDAGLGSGRLSAIKRYVERNLVRHGLSVNNVAARHGLSPRQVQRLFESEGRTFSQYVLHKRLERVYSALMDVRLRERNIGDIALEHGFGDFSTFTRAFRTRYGASPRDVRNRSFVAADSDN